MADQLQQRPGPHAGGKPQSQRPSTSQVLAVVTLVPAGGILLVLSGLALACSVIGLAVTTPLFVIFSPVLVPAAITIALAITGFLLSGAFGITALSSLSWIINHLRVVAAQMGQKTRELGQGIQKQVQQEGQKRG